MISSRAPTPSATSWRVRAVWRSGGPSAVPPPLVAGCRGAAGRRGAPDTRVGSSSSKKDMSGLVPACGQDAQYDRVARCRANLQVCRQSPDLLPPAAGGRPRGGEGGRWCRPPTTRWRPPTPVTPPPVAGRARALPADAPPRRRRLRRRLARARRAPRPRRRGEADRAARRAGGRARRARGARRGAAPAPGDRRAATRPGRDEDAVYLVSELVRGRTLADLVEDGALSDRDILRIGAALCDALAHAHARGVVHRDVKPANIMVPERPSGEAGLAKLTDFGVATIAGDDALTRTGDVVGTLAYMAPEQAEGHAVEGRGRPLRARARALRGAVRRQPDPRRRRGRDRAPRRHAPPAARAPAPRPAARGVRARSTARCCRVPRTAARSEDLRLALDAAVDGAARDGRSRRRGPARRRGTRRPSPRATARSAAPRPSPAAPAAATAAAALVAATIGAAPAALAPGPGAPLAAGAAAALAVLLLPRAGWLARRRRARRLARRRRASPARASSWSPPSLPTVAAAARATALLWSAPAGAPLLGLAGLALAWPALAGQARDWTQRAALGALGRVVAGARRGARRTAAAARRRAGHRRARPLGGLGDPRGHGRARAARELGRAHHRGAVGRARLGAAADRARAQRHDRRRRSSPAGAPAWPRGPPRSPRRCRGPAVRRSRAASCSARWPPERSPCWAPQRERPRPPAGAVPSIHPAASASQAGRGSTSP